MYTSLSLTETIFVNELLIKLSSIVLSPGSTTQLLHSHFASCCADKRLCNRRQASRVLSSLWICSFPRGPRVCPARPRQPHSGSLDWDVSALQLLQWLPTRGQRCVQKSSSSLCLPPERDVRVPLGDEEAKPQGTSKPELLNIFCNESMLIFF